jgi:hypothetical protein
MQLRRGGCIYQGPDRIRQSVKDLGDVRETEAERADY